MRHIFEVYKTNVHAMLSYLPNVYSGRLTLFQASEEQQTGVEPEHLVWSKFSSRPVTVYPVPGNHFTILSRPHVQILAEQLKMCIAQSIENVRRQ